MERGERGYGVLKSQQTAMPHFIAIGKASGYWASVDDPKLGLNLISGCLDCFVHLDLELLIQFFLHLIVLATLKHLWWHYSTKEKSFCETSLQVGTGLNRSTKQSRNEITQEDYPTSAKICSRCTVGSLPACFHLFCFVILGAAPSTGGYFEIAPIPTFKKYNGTSV